MSEDARAAYFELDEFWTSSNDTLPSSVQRRLRETIGLMPPGARSVLDVGGGDGRLVRLLQERSGVDLAVNLERSAAAIAAGPRPAVQGSIDRLPIADGAVDLVVSAEVIEHLPNALFDASIAELERVAGRWLLITVPNEEDLQLQFVSCPECLTRFHPSGHLRSFREETLRGLVSPSFRLLSTHRLGPTRWVHPPWLVASIRRARGRRAAAEPGGRPQCPQCGTRFGSGTSRSSDEPRSGSSRHRMMRRALGGRERPIWLAALFERA